ncbi:hypothetical protein [Duganella vulcania]|uniref:Uncharacterized protein n=1 Tax=Duganella vulcania TaxID=2692166 RepID=A0A845GFT4_9BURK|nr:hypothetical protein [Duganella vulcania]MYM92811.1 hypothetical protein [Duganella vulcania]
MASVITAARKASGNPSGMVSLYVGPSMSEAYHQLDNAARARVRERVKLLFRESMLHENPALSVIGSSPGDGTRSSVRGLLRVVIDVMRKGGRLMTVVEITTAVHERRPDASSSVVRRLLNKCVDVPAPIMMRQKIKNPSTVLHARRDQVFAFALLPEIQRQRRSGSVVQDGQVCESIVESIVHVVLRSVEPPTAREIHRLLKRPEVSLQNLYTYLSDLKQGQVLCTGVKKKDAGRLVNTYVPGPVLLGRDDPLAAGQATSLST